jgi:hypothetical protein
MMPMDLIPLSQKCLTLPNCWKCVSAALFVNGRTNPLTRIALVLLDGGEVVVADSSAPSSTLRSFDVDSVATLSARRRLADGDVGNCCDDSVTHGCTWISCQPHDNTHSLPLFVGLIPCLRLLPCVYKQNEIGGHTFKRLSQCAIEYDHVYG